MASRRVVRVAGHVSLLPIGPPERDLPLGDHAPMLTLAAVVGQADEQRGRVDVLLEGLERHRIAAQKGVSTLNHFEVYGYRCASSCWHWAWCPPA